MASLPNCAPAWHPIGAFRRPLAGVNAPFLIFKASPRSNLNTHINLRLEKDVGAQVKNRLNHVFASNTNPSNGSDDAKTSDAAPGPPFLTILAGVLVFLFICWIIGSIAMWLIGLIVQPPPLK